MAQLAQCFKKTTVAESLVEEGMATDSVDPGERSHAGTPVVPGIVLGKAQPKKPKDGATKRGQKIGSKSSFTKSTGYSRGTGRPDSKLPTRKEAKASPIPGVMQGRSPATGLVTTVAGPSRGKTALGEEPALLRICMKKKRLQKEAKAQMVTASQLGNRASAQELQKERKRRTTGSGTAPGKKIGGTPARERAGRQKGPVASDTSPEAKVVRRPSKRGEKFAKFRETREPETGLQRARPDRDRRDRDPETGLQRARPDRDRDREPETGWMASYRLL